MRKYLLIFILFLFISKICYAETNYVVGLITEVNSKILYEDSEDNLKKTKFSFKVKILEGKDKDKIIELVNKSSYEYEYNKITPKAGTKVLLINNGNNYEIIDIYRIETFYWHLTLFFILTLIFLKFKGLKFLITTILLFGFIYYFILPTNLIKFPILIFIISYLISSVFILFLTKGINNTFKIVSIALFINYLTSYILISIFESFYSNFYNNFYILIPIAGALTYLTYSIISKSLALKLNKQDLNNKKLFKIAYKIGINECIPIMTIIFLLYILNITYNLLPIYTSIESLNSSSLISEFSKLLNILISLIISIPITSYIYSQLNSKSVE